MVSEGSARPKATILITSKNRKDELRVAVTSALAQSGKPEVLVIDDGSTDGTSDLIRAEFPQVNLHRFEKSDGLIVQRNRGAELAAGEFVFSMDDDAIFSSPDVVAQTLADFDQPRIGAVAIPFINVKQDNRIRQAAPDKSGIYIAASYIGTAHALRRDLFLKLGGYRGCMVHQGEEADYCIRMLEDGYVVRLGRADPIHHFESPRRDFRRMDLYGRRNDVLFAFWNVPLSRMPLHVLMTSFNGLKFGVTCGRPLRHAQGVMRGWGAMFTHRKIRKPVSLQTYELYRRLKKSGSVPLAQIENQLPPLAT
jgi:glycosyltransferase involved in cell wall biosynthesis